MTGDAGKWKERLDMFINTFMPTFLTSLLQKTHVLHYNSRSGFFNVVRRPKKLNSQANKKPSEDKKERKEDDQTLSPS